MQNFTLLNNLQALANEISYQFNSRDAIQELLKKAKAKYSTANWYVGKDPYGSPLLVGAGAKYRLEKFGKSWIVKLID